MLLGCRAAICFLLLPGSEQRVDRPLFPRTRPCHAPSVCARLCACHLNIVLGVEQDLFRRAKPGPLTYFSVNGGK